MFYAYLLLCCTHVRSFIKKTFLKSHNKGYTKSSINGTKFSHGNMLIDLWCSMQIFNIIISSISGLVQFQCKHLNSFGKFWPPSNCIREYWFPVRLRLICFYVESKRDKWQHPTEREWDQQNIRMKMNLFVTCNFFTLSVFCTSLVKTIC